MRHSNRATNRAGWQWALVIAFALSGADSAVAGPLLQSKSTATRASSDQEATQSPMYSRDGSIPYSVRMKITASLARQHAREGNARRALIEYHSILNVDDPSWADDLDGDSLRIARDLEVAQMMAESGFYDHAIRSLETASVLARVNSDPQAMVVQRQIKAIIELAALKGVTVKAMQSDKGPLAEAITRTNAEGPAINGPNAVETTTRPTTEIPGRYSRQVPEPPNVPGPSRTTQTPPAFDSSDRPPALAESAQPASSPAEKFYPRQHPGGTVAEPHGPMRPLAYPQHATVAHDVAPTYCAECAARFRASQQVWSSAQPPQAMPAPLGGWQPGSATPPAPVETLSTRRRLLDWLMFGSKRDQMPPPVIVSGGPNPKDHLIPYPLPPASPTNEPTRPAGRVLQSDTLPNARATSLPGTVRGDNGAQAQPAAGSRRDVSLAGHQAASSSQNAATPEATGPTSLRNDARSPRSTMKTPQRVGVAGQVANPGIFTLDGPSTTLDSLLRRAGGETPASRKQARIVRSVDLHTAGSDAAPQKDFYCQHKNLSQPGKRLATPGDSQELVIVDGGDQQPIYLAVMPHFVLQLPADPDHPLTATQIVDELAKHWPAIGQREIGMLRYEDWGNATKLTGRRDSGDSEDTPLQSGDVLYVDGLDLDHTAVLSAAEAIGQLAGAKVRTAESPTPVDPPSESSGPEVEASAD